MLWALMVATSFKIHTVLKVLDQNSQYTNTFSVLLFQVVLPSWSRTRQTPNDRARCWTQIVKQHKLHCVSRIRQHNLCALFAASDKTSKQQRTFLKLLFAFTAAKASTTNVLKVFVPSSPNNIRRFDVCGAHDCFFAEQPMDVPGVGPHRQKNTEVSKVADKHNQAT